VSLGGTFLRHVWSNIHFGYVGASVGFPEALLQFGADLGRRYPVLSGVVGDNGPADVVSIDIGYSLWEEHGENLTVAQLVSAVRAGQPRYQGALILDPGDLPQRVRPYEP
jgi:hypothetical protein